METSQTADADTSSEWYEYERDEWFTDGIPHTSVGHACGMNNTSYHLHSPPSCASHVITG
jgi:hypothetical protein